MYGRVKRRRSECRCLAKCFVFVYQQTNYLPLQECVSYCVEILQNLVYKVCLKGRSINKTLLNLQRKVEVTALAGEDVLFVRTGNYTTQIGNNYLCYLRPKMKEMGSFAAHMVRSFSAFSLMLSLEALFHLRQSLKPLLPTRSSVCVINQTHATQ